MMDTSSPPSAIDEKKTTTPVRSIVQSIEVVLVGCAAVSLNLVTHRSSTGNKPSTLRPVVGSILAPIFGGPVPSFNDDVGRPILATLSQRCDQVTGWLSRWNTSPQAYFETCLVLLLVPGVLMFLRQNVLTLIVPKKPKFASENMLKETKPPVIRSFQLLYLPVFWLLRTSFWMSGPYFFPVYASKVLENGQPISFSTIGQIFHAGFAIAAVCLPLVAKLTSKSYTDEKTGTIFAAIFYGLGAASTQSSTLWILFAGRGLGSIGTGLLSVMPEAWLSSEVQKTGADPYGRWLGNTFAAAYGLDSIVAIGAGQMASWTADTLGGPTGPFKVSPIFLAVAAVIVGLLWTDSDVPTGKDGEKEDSEEDESGLSLRESVKIILSDPKIIMIGLVQCTFEAAMYVFVLNQAPAVKAAAAKFFADGTASVMPSGLIFCCFMACCLLGSNLYRYLAERQCRPERVMTAVVTIAAAALICASLIVSGSYSENMGLLELTAAFFVFELCVGVYYPSISWLRSKYLPVAHRSVIMTIVTVPFNLLVLAISAASSSIIGVAGAWATASALLLVSFACLVQLQRIARREALENLPKTWKRIKAKWIGIARVIQIRKITQGIAKQAAAEEEE